MLFKLVPSSFKEVFGFFFQDLMTLVGGAKNGLNKNSVDDWFSRWMSKQTLNKQ